MADQVIVVGGGAAACAAAEELSRYGHGSTLIVDEPTLPYDRRPLSKATLRSADSQPPHLYEAGWFEERKITVRCGYGVRQIDRQRQELMLDDGAWLRYDALVLAPGSWPRSMPSFTGTSAHALRSWYDAAALRDELRAEKHLVIVGGGWIALEVAATAHALGMRVSILHRGPDLLEGEVDAIDAERIAVLHRSHGVHLHADAVISGVAPRAHSHGLDVVTSDGVRYAADSVLVAIGIRPKVSVAEDAGLRVADGIVVDEYMRTDDPKIMAAGDACSAFHPLAGRRIRVSTWSHAQAQGRTAAATILGRDAPCTAEPVLTSRQYDTVIEARGFRGAYRVTMRADAADAEHRRPLERHQPADGLNVNPAQVNSAQR